MTPTYSQREGKDRAYSRRRKQEELQSQIDRLPNEFKSCLNDYNHNAVGGLGHIDTNDYGHSEGFMYAGYSE